MAQNGKVALVTGSSRGIGFSIARELARLGYTLGVVSRSNTDIEEAADKLRAEVHGSCVVAGSFDVTDSVEVEGFVAELRDRYGSIAVLVNNAGEYITGTSEIACADAERMLQVNYLSAVRFIQAIVPTMKGCNSGHIINVASLCGVTGFADVGAYCASKFAMVGYSEALGRELDPFGIRVTALCPSWVNTRMASRSPLASHEMIQPEDLGRAVSFILSLSPAVRIRQLVLDCE